MGIRAERRAARERVSAYHQAQLAELLSHVAAAIDRYRVGEIDACTVDETLHHYHRAVGELWKFCFARGGGSHAEFIAGLLDHMTAGAETIDWWDRANDPNPNPPRLRFRAGEAVTDRGHASRRLSAPSRRYARTWASYRSRPCQFRSGHSGPASQQREGAHCFVATTPVCFQTWFPCREISGWLACCLP